MHKQFTLSDPSRYMAEILPIQRKTLYNQSIISKTKNPDIAKMWHAQRRSHWNITYSKTNVSSLKHNPRCLKKYFKYINV